MYYSGATEPNGDEPTKQQRTPRGTTASPAPRETPVASKHSTSSVTRKTRTPAPKLAAPTTTRSDKSLIQRPTSANRQRSSPTPRQQTTSRKQTTPRKQTTARTPAADLAPNNQLETPVPESPTESSPLSSSPLPESPVEADLVAVPPTVQALAALPNEDSGRRRNSSSSSRGTWTIDDGSASPRSFSPDGSLTASPAKGSPKSPRRAFAL